MVSGLGQAGAEIEVTREMIDAGTLAFYEAFDGNDAEYANVHATVIRIANAILGDKSQSDEIP